MAQGDAAGVNGSNRIMSHGAPRLRMTPNGCLGSPVLVLLFGLDRGFLMDVGPQRAPWLRFVWSCRESPDPAGRRRVKRSVYLRPKGARGQQHAVEAT